MHRIKIILLMSPVVVQIRPTLFYWAIPRTKAFSNGQVLTDIVSGPNINSSPAKWIDVGTNIGGNYTYDYGYQANDNSESSIVSWTYRLPTMVPLYDISGTTYGGSRSAGMGNGQNAVFLLDKNQYDFTKQINLTGNAYLKLNLMKGLSVQTRVGINQYQYNSQDINYVEVAAAERGTYDYYGKGAGWGTNWTWTNTIDYSLVHRTA